MAEVLAIAASVIAVIQITDRVVHFCKSYVENVRDLPSDIRIILVELSTLKTVLENLKFLIDSDGITSPLLSGLGGSNGSIEECRSLVAELEQLLNSETTTEARTKENGKSKLSLAALKWPLKQTKAQRLLSKIAHFKSTITLAITAEATADIKEIKDTSKEIHSMLTAHQRQEVYRWLFHTDPAPLHYIARKNFEPGTGDWMLQLSEWERWLNAEIRFLWIHGIPGAGKTVLFSQLVEKTKEHCTSLQPDRVACVYYYCYFDRKQDETRPFLRWILGQLCQQADWLPQSTYELYETGSEPDIDDLLIALADIAGRFTMIYILIDALDESSPREDLLETLETIRSQGRFAKIQLLATSRKYSDIESSLLGAAYPVSMSNPSVEADIRLYVHATLNSNRKFRQRWSQDFLDEIESVLPPAAEGMFRWAVCQIDLLQRIKPDRQTIRRALGSLPKTLYDTYDRILSLIPEEDRLIAHHTLQWIRYHSTVYPAKGIPRYVLSEAVEKSMALATNDENDRRCDNEALKEICGCLIRSERAFHEDMDYTYEYSVVSFAHYTVLEYCSLAQTPNAPTGCPSPFRLSADLILAETILRGAHSIKSGGTWMVGGNSLLEDPELEIYWNFFVYCIYPSLCLIRDSPADLINDSRLCQLTLSLMEPSEGGDNALRTEFQKICSGGYNLFSSDICDLADFHVASGHAKQSQLLDIFHLNGLTPEHGLLQKFLQQENPEMLFGSNITIDVQSSGRLSAKTKRSIKREASMIEILAMWISHVAEESLNIVLKHSAGYFDPSVILYEVITNHEPVQCHSSTCPIDMLLELGADPNLSRHNWLSPLQVAVLREDVEAVRKLLSAGANASFGEDSHEIVRPDEIFHTDFRERHGKRPFSIDLDYPRDHSFDPDSPAVTAIKRLLIQHGAKEANQS